MVGYIRKCDLCHKAMGNSWHTEKDFGQLEIYVHQHCSKEWRKLKGKEDFVRAR